VALRPRVPHPWSWLLRAADGHVRPSKRVPVNQVFILELQLNINKKNGQVDDSSGGNKNVRFVYALHLSAVFMQCVVN
jgi:hypothetical protein